MRFAELESEHLRYRSFKLDDFPSVYDWSDRFQYAILQEEWRGAK